MSDKITRIHMEIDATSLSIARMIPQFIEDNEQLETLIGYILDLRNEITSGDHRRESLIIVDAFLTSLQEVL
jgi:hypothetical protein